VSHSLTDDTDKTFLQQAVQLAMESVEKGGAPFGALVVHNGKVIARAGNRAKQDCDPTAHAEVAAIRMAGKMLGNAHMPQATLYASCEPCPMCLAATHWARIPRMCLPRLRKLQTAPALPTAILQSSSTVRLTPPGPNSWG